MSLPRVLLLAGCVFFFLNIAIAQEAPPTTAAPANTQAPTIDKTSDDAYVSQRKFAFDLMNGGHELEALPVFAELAKKKPDDGQVLFGLGACMIKHSGTLPDGDEARQERVQARKLLLQAKALGFSNALMMNLIEMTPEDGSILHASNPDVDKALQAGEVAFSKNDYDEAIQQYSKVMELDPQNYSAALYIGDCYFAKKDIPKATEWYEHAIQISPDTETAYRYECDMLTKSGDMQKARTRAIQAIVANPYNAVPWRGLQQWANANHVQIKQVKINTHSDVSADGKSNINITLDPKGPGETGMIWIIYAGSRARWHQGEFKKRFPDEKDYRHTMAEESEALSAAAGMLSGKKEKAINADPDLALLKKIADAKLLEAYVLLGVPDQGIAQDYVAYRAQNRAKLEQYLGQFVVPEVPTKH